MTEILFADVTDATVADDAETVLTAVTIPLLRVDSSVLIPWFVSVGTPDGDVTAWNVRVRRDDIDGVQVGGVNDALVNQWFPAIDTPGLPATVTYVITLELVDAGGPSTGINGFGAVIYNTP